jgi:multidrug efflux system membrane fusion protein
MDDESLNRSRAWRKRRWPWIVAALIVVAIVLLVILHERQVAAARRAAAKPQGAAITVGESTIGDINVYVQALGTVTPLRTVTVYPQITGEVVSVHFREGQIVKKGEALIDIDPRPYQTTLTQAEGNLEHDEALLAEAQMDLKRYQAAYARNAIAKQQLDDQEQTVVQDEGSVKADRGAVAYDQVQLSYCHIVSPVAGKVGLRLVDPGNTVFSGSGSTLVVITQLEPTTVVFSVSEDDLPQVQTELNAGHTLSVDAFDRSHDAILDSGKLTALDNEVDTTTGTVKLRAEFPNKKRALFPNQFVNARLLVHTLRQVTLVPSAAVQHNGTKSFVYLVKPDDTVAVQPVTVLTSENEKTAVDGLGAGAKLATSGFDRLEAGAHVVVRAKRAATGSSSSTASASGTAAP